MLQMVFFRSVLRVLVCSCEMFGYYPDEVMEIFNDKRLNLERVMTNISLQMDLFDKPTYAYGTKGLNIPIGKKRLYTLIELIARTFEEALKGPYCEKHRKLADSMEKGDIVFSYNYDILMDNALRDVGKLCDGGYFLNFTSVFTNTGWIRPEENSSQVKLIKLHGSLNWIRCSICHSIFLFRNLKIGQWNVGSLQEKCARCGANEMYLSRVLILPLLTKDYADIEINYLWIEAKKALRNIEEIVVIGYSLPPTDFASETLLRVGIKGDKHNKIPVTIVDPDPKVSKRYSKIFNSQKISTIKDFNEYLKRI